MTRKVRQRVVSIMNDVFEMSISSEENPNRNDINNWDSLRHMELILHLEEEFNIRFSIEQVGAIEDLNDVVQIIEVSHGSQHKG